MAVSVRIGCQGWSHDPWVGTFFTRGARREEYLPQYASVFGAVEGNTTFYALPKKESVARWAAEAPAAFHFCFKFPKAISHERRLVNASIQTEEFLDRVAPLGERLGTFFLQLHESFGPTELPALKSYLRSLPQEFRYAVEVRHAGFFDHGDGEARVTDLVAGLGMEQVVFDTRGLFAAPPTAEVVRIAQGKKPRSPLRIAAHGRRPFVRFVGNPDIAADEPLLDEWARVFAGWIAEGRTPYFFAHHADDTFSPAVARAFQKLLHARCPQVPPPPEWPVEQQAAANGAQLDLFQ